MVRSATVNDWGAVAWSAGGFAESVQRPGLEVFDRVGGGDSFASGLIYGLMEKGDLSRRGRVRSRARCPGDDHARRHQHGQPGRGGEPDERRERTGTALVGRRGCRCLTCPDCV